jgi:hypothetical protein
LRPSWARQPLLAPTDWKQKTCIASAGGSNREGYIKYQISLLAGSKPMKTRSWACRIRGYSSPKNGVGSRSIGPSLFNPNEKSRCKRTVAYLYATLFVRFRWATREHGCEQPLTRNLSIHADFHRRREQSRTKRRTIPGI